MPNEPIRVLLVDDHAVVRAGYHHFLEKHADIRVVAEAEDGEQGYREYCEHRPDVSIVDLTLPGAGGLELIRRIYTRDADVAVLVFTMHEDALFALRALDAGAKGYVTKSNPPSVLIDAVMQVARKKIFLSPDITEQIALRRVTREQDPFSALSSREFEIFRMITEGESITDISTALCLSQKSIANYQTQIKQKLNVTSIAGLVHIAIKHGVIKVAY
jgi:two-component system, NarL family, invasion response regulator UvrY